MADRQMEAGHKPPTGASTLGTEAEFVWVGGRQKDSGTSLVDLSLARFGRLEPAITLARTLSSAAADVTPESYQAIFDTNVLGVLLWMKYEIRAMLPQGKGSIVNISSSYGQVGGPTASDEVGLDSGTVVGSSRGVRRRRWLWGMTAG